MQTFLRFLAAAVEFSHGLVMVVWGLGLPLLLWHRFQRLSRLYMWLSLAFVGGSVLSHQLLGECVLTALARWLWQRAGVQAEDVPFIAQLTNQVARIRPSARSVVLMWEAGIAIYCMAFLWGQRGLLQRSPRHAAEPATESARGGSAPQC